mmetsp:Transcript_60294/g.142047  ORF Transcript_60294/g.142047 Transcript_60294/m.142047 type:complete len:283 (+) Transcript_60294:42-890(+)
MSGASSTAVIRDAQFPNSLFIFCIVIAAISVSILRLRSYSRSNKLRLSAEGSKKNTLLLIAHPDDEAMFFVPTIEALKPHETVYVLCLSNGDFDGLGKTREVELLKSCKHLNIPEERVLIVDDPGLQDGPMNVWDVEHVAEFLLPFIARHSISALVTFDGYGVSGHPNHIALYAAVLQLLRSTKLSPNLRVFVLESVPLFRKFIGPLAVLEHEVSSMLSGRTSAQEDDVITASLLDLPLVARSLFAHRSQAAWFRWLFILFGRYSFFNVLRRLPSSAKLSAP